MPLKKVKMLVSVMSNSGGSDGKELPAVQETKVLFLGQEDNLEKGMATHSSILAWRIPWTEESLPISCLTIFNLPWFT